MYAPFPIICRSGVSLGLVLATWNTPATGAPTVAGYWNFADSTYEVGPFDKTKHIKPFTRIGVDGLDADFKLQIVSVPNDAFGRARPSICVYEIGPDGERSDLSQVADPTYSREMVGLSK